MDQSAINKIILDNSTAEDPNKRVEKLEKEVMILKGSIKKLIVDIREQMNNAENPFLNIQQLQMPAQAPVIKEDPIELDVPENPDMPEGMEGGVKKSDKPKKPKKPKAGPGEEEELEPEETAGDDPREPMAEDDMDAALPSDEAAGPKPLQPEFSRRDLDVMKDFEEQKKMLEAMKSKTIESGPAALTGSKRMDPYTMNQIMDWTRMMLRKNGPDRMRDLLEMYVSTGYISEETKVIVQRMAKLMEAEPTRPPKRLDIKECVSDLYTLYVILNPGDKVLDSNMLSVLLNAEDRY